MDTAEYEVVEGYLVPVHYEEDRVWGSVREMLDCYAEGRDLDEFRAKMAEAIQRHEAG